MVMETKKIVMKDNIYTYLYCGVELVRYGNGWAFNDDNVKSLLQAS